MWTKKIEWMIEPAVPNAQLIRLHLFMAVYLRTEHRVSLGVSRALKKALPHAE